MSDSILARCCAHPPDLISSGVAARMMGVSITTVRNLCQSGTLRYYKVGTASHRRISRRDVENYLEGYEAESYESKKKCVLYARVSGYKQNRENRIGESDLSRQMDRLEAYAIEHYGELEIEKFSDIGSGLNFLRKGLNKLVEKILSGELDGSVILCENRDRLTRFGYEIIEKIAAHRNIAITYIAQEDINDEALLQADLLSILHIFSTRSYSKRSAERTRKRLSENVLARGKELMDAGLSLKAVTKKLNGEGYRCEDGTELNYNTVRKYIFLQSAKLEVFGAGRNSAKDYVAQFVERGPDNLRTEIRKVYEHYVKWCGETNQEAVSRNKFGSYFRGFEHTWSNEGRAYVGLVIKGTGLGRAVRVKTVKPDESPNQQFERFLEQLRPFNGYSSEIYESYVSFCRENGIRQPLTHIHVGRLLRRLGNKPKRDGKGFFYKIA